MNDQANQNLNWVGEDIKIEENCADDDTWKNSHSGLVESSLTGATDPVVIIC